jgi:hypothetical protein
MLAGRVKLSLCPFLSGLQFIGSPLYGFQGFHLPSCSLDHVEMRLASSRSAHLKVQPMAQRHKRWSGDYIIVWPDNSWEFFRCCRCGKLLSDAASRKRGLGPECKDRAAVDEVIGVKRREREKMRAWLKQQELRRTSRDEALAVVCPRCGAMADEPCIGEGGQSRRSSHVERHQHAIELGARPLRRPR